MFSARTFLSVSRALLTGRSPFYVQYYVIGKCNLSCRQCNIVETNSRLPTMSLEQIEAFATHLARVGGGIVLLTGGEPFMEPRLPEIVRIFVSRGLNVRLQTAGSRYATEEMLAACYEAGARDINVSLDSLDQANFDYINATPGSAVNAIETIERISRIFRKNSSILSLGTVVSRFNYKEIPSILEFARRIGWFVSLVPVHIAPASRPRGFQSHDAQFVFEPRHFSELDALFASLLELKRAGAPLFDSPRFLKSALAFLKGEPPTWRSGGLCDSPDLYFTVRPNGEFTTCCDYTLQSAPKVYSPEFSDLYLSGKIAAREDVRRIVRSCEGCHYGSYPEISLSIHDPRVFLERAALTLRGGRGRLRAAPVRQDFLAETEKIRAARPEVYPITQWQDAPLAERIARWSRSEERRAVLAEDLAARKIQNRVRGMGEEPRFL